MDVVNDTTMEKWANVSQVKFISLAELNGFKHIRIMRLLNVRPNVRQIII
jgi:hypothetical protein